MKYSTYKKLLFVAVVCVSANLQAQEQPQLKLVKALQIAPLSNGNHLEISGSAEVTTKKTNDGKNEETEIVFVSSNSGNLGIYMLPKSSNGLQSFIDMSTMGFEKYGNTDKRKSLNLQGLAVCEYPKKNDANKFRTVFLVNGNNQSIFKMTYTKAVPNPSPSDIEAKKAEKYGSFTGIAVDCKNGEAIYVSTNKGAILHVNLDGNIQVVFDSSEWGKQHNFTDLYVVNGDFFALEKNEAKIFQFHPIMDISGADFGENVTLEGFSVTEYDYSPWEFLYGEEPVATAQSLLVWETAPGKFTFQIGYDNNGEVLNNKGLQALDPQSICNNDACSNNPFVITLTQQ
jgi:hypothetical protein